MIINGELFLGDYDDVVSLIRSETIYCKDAKQSGDNLMITCPFHADGQESKPSCGISLNDTRRGSRLIPEGTVHCFACNTTKSLPEMISHCYGYEDGGAYGLSWLYQHFSNVTIEMRKPLELDFSRDNKVKEKKIITQEEMAKYYTHYHPYLESRGIRKAVVDFFNIGYDLSSGSIVFPVTDKNGLIRGLAKRSVTGKTYINEHFEKSELIYGLDKIYKHLDRVEKVYICEGFVDCLTLWSFRQPAIAILGAFASDTQLKLIDELPIRHKVLMLDNYKVDKAGHKGINRLQSGLKTLAYLYEYPNDKKDANELTYEEFCQGKEILYTLPKLPRNE